MEWDINININPLPSLILDESHVSEKDVANDTFEAVRMPALTHGSYYTPLNKLT